MWPEVAGAETHGSPSLNILKNMVSKHVFRRYLGNGFAKLRDFLARERSGAENLFKPRIGGIGARKVGEKRGPIGKIGPEFSYFRVCPPKICVLHVHVVMGVARGTGLCEAGVWLGLL